MKTMKQCGKFQKLQLTVSDSMVCSTYCTWAIWFFRQFWFFLVRKYGDNLCRCSRTLNFYLSPFCPEMTEFLSISFGILMAFFIVLRYQNTGVYLFMHTRLIVTHLLILYWTPFNCALISSKIWFCCSQWPSSTDFEAKPAKYLYLKNAWQRLSIRNELEVKSAAHCAMFVNKFALHSNTKWRVQIQ